jgi:hypothetical protein
MSVQKRYNSEYVVPAVQSVALHAFAGTGDGVCARVEAGLLSSSPPIQVASRRESLAQHSGATGFVTGCTCSYPGEKNEKWLLSVIRAR